MASIGKREFAKKDMNFFSEFAASSQASAKMIRNMVIGGIIVLGLLVAWIFFLLAKLGITNAEIKKYDDKFKSPEYVEAQSKAIELAAESAHINKYAYAISNMDATVTRETGIKKEILDHLKSHIPSTIIVTDYELTKGSLVVKGQSLKKSSVQEFAHMLNENDIFYRDPDISFERIDPKELGDKAFFVTNYLNASYSFEINARLDIPLLVTVSRVLNDSTVIEMPTNELFDGDVYPMEGINTCNVNGQDCTLTSVSINGEAIPAEELQNVINTGNFSVFLRDDTTIQLVYAKPVEEQAPAEGES